jgi:hypothetical protein
MMMRTQPTLRRKEHFEYICACVINTISSRAALFSLSVSLRDDEKRLFLSSFCPQIGVQNGEFWSVFGVFNAKRVH